MSHMELLKEASGRGRGAEPAEKGRSGGRVGGVREASRGRLGRSEQHVGAREEKGMRVCWGFLSWGGACILREE